MKKKFQRKSVRLWLEALRSKLYKQTRGQLRDERGFCCLGVACEVYNLQQRKNHKKQLTYKYFKYDGEFYRLPIKVQRWLGLTSVNGDYCGHLTSTNLIHKNDRGFSFNKIADIIESNPKGLFVE